MLSWDSIGDKLKRATGTSLAVFSDEGRIVFSNFEVSEELVEAAKVALKTRIKVSMHVGVEKVLIVPRRLHGSWKAFVFVGYDVSEEGVTNLLLELLECWTSQHESDLKLEKVLIETLKIFFENDLSITKASSIMGVHKNTILYRLNKVREVTGFDPRKFNDAMKLRSLLGKHFE